MTTVEHSPAVMTLPSAARIGQGTAIAQSRAVAEVQAMVLVARQFPRSEADAIRRMQTACSQRALALKAFWRFKRGDSNVTGETIQLARELARCWGNIQYSVDELRRDGEYGQSEMQAWAWDMEVNERVGTIFIVPHKRDTQEGGRALTTIRDIYENNANNGARRLREQIFAVLPVWFIEMAKSVCLDTLARGKDGDTPRPTRIAQAIAVFEGLNVTADQLEVKLGRHRDDWTDLDLAQLEVIHVSISRGEVTVTEEFPPPRVTIDDIVATAPAETAAEDNALEPSQHIDHPEGEFDAWCAACIESREVDQRAAQE